MCQPQITNQTEKDRAQKSWGREKLHLLIPTQVRHPSWSLRGQKWTGKEKYLSTTISIKACFSAWSERTTKIEPIASNCSIFSLFSWSNFTRGIDISWRDLVSASGSDVQAAAAPPSPSPPPPPASPASWKQTNAICYCWGENYRLLNNLPE